MDFSMKMSIKLCIYSYWRNNCFGLVLCARTFKEKIICSVDRNLVENNKYR